MKRAKGRVSKSQTKLKSSSTNTRAKRKQPTAKPAGAASPPPRRPSPLTPAPEAGPLRARRGFPIVGIGASAGGLEALEQFLRNVPEKSGMAFVVVQHLDPTHKGAMVELLQRSSSMPVVQVKDRLKVEPNSVYVIPPNKDMSILHGELHLMPQVAPRGLNLPIDFFFRSLAEDQQERGIGVVLSGMGSDGTLGLRAIKEKAGAGFVQALSSAKFDGMPRSVIEAGVADVVAPVEDLPGKIIAYTQHAVSQPALPLEEKQLTALEKIFILLRDQTGNDFSLYKKSTIYRRIERRMGLHQIAKINDYVRYLRENPTETELLFKELLIGVTSFFRDPDAWDYLKTKALPALLQARRGNGPLRAWVAGCSTGEEPYSLAIVSREVIEKLQLVKNITLQIFGTDLDRDAIEAARLGVYPANIAADVSPERLRRFFVQNERGGYRVSKEIREMVVFAPQNIIMDPPFTKLDILCCRNLLIYLSPELQKKLIPLFHYSLLPNGILFLGSAETVGAHHSLFGPIDGKTRIYRRLEAKVGAPQVEFPANFTGPAAPEAAEEQAPAKPPQNLAALADRVILAHVSPAAVLASDKGDILYIRGRTGKYLEPAVGKANLNIFAMAREGLRHELTSAFGAVLRSERPVMVRGIKVITNGGTQAVDLMVQKLNEPKELRGTVIIVINDVPAPAEAPPKQAPATTRRSRIQDRLAELAHELQQSREELQTTREEMQTSQEELKSTNEELQSTNEELQSTNEELTTSKEEMQSMNEELQTVNHELQSKVDELSRSNNDMKNLLNSTDIATLFLDGELRVRRFTPQTTHLIKLIPGDAGRPITDITTDLDYSDLAEDAREVLRTLVFKEKYVVTYDERWFVVRIMPYRTLENVIDGVVMTFSDATPVKKLEATLKERSSEIADFLPSLIWRASPDGKCDYVNGHWNEFTGLPEAEQFGDRWLDQVHPEDRARVREAWRRAVAEGTPLDTEFRLRGKGGDYRWFKTRARPVRARDGMIVHWWGTCTDIEDLKKTVEARLLATERPRGRPGAGGDGESGS